MSFANISNPSRASRISSKSSTARRGYFFDTAPLADIAPAVSFINRFPALAQRVEGSQFVARLSRLHGSGQDEIERRMFYTTTLLMLPNYNFYTSPIAYAEIGIRNAIRDLFTYPVGTLWIYGVARTSEGRSNTLHAQPILRVPEGLMFIPTNIHGADYNTYRLLFFNSIVRDEVGAMNVITRNRTRAALRFYTMRLLGPQQAPINLYVSNSNCTGLGDDRRGNNRLPLSATINQCASGRCGI